MGALASGDSLDHRFSLIRPLGRGGMAEIWLVRDHELDREVAAKIVPPGASEGTIALLRRECQNARRLAHPHIVRVFDFHHGEKRSFITMAFVEGVDLTRLRGGSPAEIIRVLIPVADALGYAHRLGVVHRDLKPDNVIRDADGQPYVLDFGISAVLARHDRHSVAGSGSRCSMSPQQLDGDEPRPSDDLYSFGALLYELITGRPPLGPDVTDERIRSAVPEPMRTSYRFPERLQTLAARLLAKSVDERPRDMAEVSVELDSIVTELERADIAAKPAGQKMRLTPPPRVGAVRAVAPQSPPATEADSRPTAADMHRRQIILATSIIAPLVIVALVVFLVLPRWVAKSRRDVADRTPIEPIVKSTEAPSPGTNPERARNEARQRSADELRVQAARKEAAREAFEHATSIRDRLEERGVTLWAMEEFAEVQETMSRGDESLSIGAYPDAERAYDEAARRFETIAASSPDVLRAALEEGRRGLAAGDGGAAAKAFTLAATIAPRSSTALTGLRRAGSLDEVLALLDAGARSEREGRIKEAQQIYRQTVSLDPLSAEAQRSLARVQTRIGNDAFSRTMSDGLEALEEGNYTRARQAFQRAGAMRPDAIEVKEGLLQVEQSQSLERIANHRTKAVAAEGQEDWHSATGEYEAILALEPTIRFAQHGKARCAERAAMADRIAYHVTHPERLSTDEVLKEALELLVQASEIEPAGPKHRQQVKALDEIIDAADSPLPVVLLSDAMTEVVIYKVGRLGTFERRELQLRPGTYTVVGSRRGYRDVRRTLEVRAGTAPLPLTVKCEAPI
jgi:tetratricopeptide (TPR) repeat protein